MHDTPHSEESKKKMSDSHKGIVNNARRRKTIVKDGITLYQCGICKEFKPYEEFYKNKRTILGITPECKKCHCKESIRRRNKDTARENNQRYMERARKADIEKFRERDRNREREKDEKYVARRKLNNAVKRGDVVKPEFCEECAEYEEIGTVEECREAMEKQRRKIVKNQYGTNYVLKAGYCPVCGCGVTARWDYCQCCGQKLNWRMHEKAH